MSSCIMFLYENLHHWRFRRPGKSRNHYQLHLNIAKFSGKPVSRTQYNNRLKSNIRAVLVKKAYYIWLKFLNKKLIQDSFVYLLFLITMLYMFCCHHTILCVIFNHVLYKEPSWSWSYGRWIYSYLCNQCLSSLTLLVRNPLMACRCTRYNIMW
jgi:hypothetical protein